MQALNYLHHALCVQMGQQPHTCSSSSARMYITALLLFPATAEAVHLKLLLRAGEDKVLLLPPVGCNILKEKSGLSLIGVLNTERISSNISVSVIEDVSLIFPNNPFRPSISLACFERGM